LIRPLVKLEEEEEEESQDLSLMIVRMKISLPLPLKIILNAQKNPLLFQYRNQNQWLKK